MIAVQLLDRIEMSQRDVLKVMQGVLDGKRTHANVVRWANRHDQLLPPVHPGERGGGHFYRGQIADISIGA